MRFEGNWNTYLLKGDSQTYSLQLDDYLLKVPFWMKRGWVKPRIKIHLSMYRRYRKKNCDPLGRKSQLRKWWYQVSSAPNTLLPLSLHLMPKLRAQYAHDGATPRISAGGRTYWLWVFLNTDFLSLWTKNSAPEDFQWFSVTDGSEFEGHEKVYSSASERQSSYQQEWWWEVCCCEGNFHLQDYNSKGFSLYKSSHIHSHFLLHFSNTLYSPFLPLPPGDSRLHVISS